MRRARSRLPTRASHTSRTRLTPAIEWLSEVPGTAKPAVHGQWVNAPGEAFLDALTTALGPLPIVAKNLGLITPEVEALR